MSAGAIDVDLQPRSGSGGRATRAARRGALGPYPNRFFGRVWLLWLVAIVLTLYAAEDIQSSLRTSSAAASYPDTIRRTTAWLVDAGRWTGLARLHRALEGSATADPDDPSCVDWPSRGPVPPSELAGAAATTATADSARDRGAGGSDTPAPALVPIRKVLMVGASTIQFHLGVELERALRASYPQLEIRRLGKLSTGLTRPDVFDWPAKLTELVGEMRPDLVIINFGGNDAQGMVLPGGQVATYGTARWEASYRERVREIVTIGRRWGARVVMLGMSSTRDPVLCRRMERINLLTEGAAREVDGDFLSIWDLGSIEGHFQDVVLIGNVPTRTRLPDGKHFSRPGAVYVADHVRQRLAKRYAFVSAPEPVPRP